MIYYIAKEYTDCPGGRFIENGPYSGEDFRENVLKRLIRECKPEEKINLVFDGAYGYPVSFLDEAFRVLAKEIGKNEILMLFNFESNDDPRLVDEIKSLIDDVKFD